MAWAAMQSAGTSCMMSPAELDHQLVTLHRLDLIWAALKKLARTTHSKRCRIIIDCTEFEIQVQNVDTVQKLY